MTQRILRGNKPRKSKKPKRLRKKLILLPNKRPKKRLLPKPPKKVPLLRRSNLKTLSSRLTKSKRRRPRKPKRQLRKLLAR